MHGMAQPLQCKGTDFTDDIDIPMTFPPGTRMPRVRPPHDGTIEWLLQLGEDLSYGI